MACRMLLVEDEVLIAMMWSSIVDLADIEIVAEAASVKQAMHALDVGDFDIAVLDVNLRGETSVLVADRLRERNIPTLVCTGDDASNLPAEYHGMPVAKKPFKIEEVIEMLTKMCPSELLAA